MAKSSTADAAGVATVRLHHESAAACSYDGRVYQADANGDVVVPLDAAAALAAHGFTVAPGRKPPETKE
ncbi:MAG TPA: hypothetical protein VFA12_19760 [Stellaceae bacterium]|nr:hypothetical protein [Stellaceae bacterium]